MTTDAEDAADLERCRIEERCGPLFDLFLRFERAFARLAIDRLNITDEDAEAFAVIMAGTGTDSGSAIAYLMRYIKTERMTRRMFHMVETVWASRESAGIAPEGIPLSELGEAFRKIQGGSA